MIYQECFKMFKNKVNTDSGWDSDQDSGQDSGRDS